MADEAKSVLTTALFRFAPQTQQIKQTAIDRIVENVIFLRGGTIENLALLSLLGGESGLLTLAPLDVNESVARLRSQGRLSSSGQDATTTVTLADAVLDEVRRERDVAERDQGRIVTDLFRGTSASLEGLSEAFLDVLADIFADLGHESVNLLRGRDSDERNQTLRDLTPYCEKAAARFGLDVQPLFSGVARFFESDEPRHNELKWRLAQSFFIAATVGLDDGTALLARDRFNRAIFYLDTNVAIPALEPADRLHRSFSLIARIGGQLDAEFRLCQITLDELKEWVDYQFGEYSETSKSLPDDALDTIGSLFGRVRRGLKKAGMPHDKRAVFQNFQSPLEFLESEYRVEREDDVWFNDERASQRTRTLMAEVGRASRVRRGKDKHEVQARHDALLLRWIQHQRWRGFQDAWVLTADTSLPAVSIRDGQGRPLVVTLDALLQWLAPGAGVGADHDKFRNVFADLIRERLLPQERFFSIQDFSIFRELGISVREMPADDVVQCVEYLKTHAVSLNLAEPADRERLHYEIKKFFADPDRRFKQELETLEAERDQLREGISQAREETQNVRFELSEEREARIADRATHDAQMGELRTEFKQARRRRGGWARFITALFVATVLLVAAIFGALRFGDQTINTVARIVEWWHVYSGIVAASVAVGYFWIGKERLALMFKREGSSE